jgi:intein-encoded DNA endonuclease-like protein
MFASLASQSQGQAVNEQKENLRLNLDEKFSEWLRGFIDGEGHFYINVRSDTSFSFRFEIHLHIDDLALLEYINNILGIGSIFSYEDKCTFVISKLEEVELLIDLLSKQPPLNSTKYLNYLDFKEAFELYTNNPKTKEIAKKIKNLKAGMNSKRTDFRLPDGHKPLITDYWLLGFVEGEGSFSVRRSSKKFELGFSLSQSVVDEVLMNSIKMYLENLALEAKCDGSDFVKVNRYKSGNTKHKESIQLMITRVDYIKNVLIDFFSSLEWHSKKELDFKDWVLILNLKERGHHFQEEGLRLLNYLINQMNNYRLSTNLKASLPMCRAEILKAINTMLEGPSNYEVVGDRTIIKSLNKPAGGGLSVGVWLEDENKNVIKTFYTITDCVKYLGITRSVFKTRLLKNKPMVINNKSVYIKKS